MKESYLHKSLCIDGVAHIMSHMTLFLQLSISDTLQMLIFSKNKHVHKRFGSSWTPFISVNVRQQTWRRSMFCYRICVYICVSLSSKVQYYAGSIACYLLIHLFIALECKRSSVNIPLLTIVQRPGPEFPTQPGDCRSSILRLKTQDRCSFLRFY